MPRTYHTTEDLTEGTVDVTMRMNDELHEGELNITEIDGEMIAWAKGSNGNKYKLNFYAARDETDAIASLIRGGKTVARLVAIEGYERDEDETATFTDVDFEGESVTEEADTVAPVQTLVTDGGEDVTDYVSDATIEDSIEQHDDPSHPDATSVAEVRECLAALQESTEALWGECVDNIERGDWHVVHEDRDVIIVDTGEHDVVRHDLRESHAIRGIDPDDVTIDVVSAVVHAVARDCCDWDWSVTYPYIIAKTDGITQGEEYVESVINSLLRQGLSPGQAWAYYGVELRGESRNAWSRRCGYSDHSATSEALRKAKTKLNR